MTIEMKKVWFVDGQIIEQEIPESDIYKRPWNIDGCKKYAKQLRDKTRANTAEHAAEAIEYLLSKRWVGLTDEEIKEIWLAGIDHGYDWLDVQGIARAIENALRSKNT